MTRRQIHPTRQHRAQLWMQTAKPRHFLPQPQLSGTETVVSVLYVYRSFFRHAMVAKKEPRHRLRFLKCLAKPPYSAHRRCTLFEWSRWSGHLTCRFWQPVLYVWRWRYLYCNCCQAGTVSTFRQVWRVIIHHSFILQNTRCSGNLLPDAVVRS